MSFDPFYQVNIKSLLSKAQVLMEPPLLGFPVGDILWFLMKGPIYIHVWYMYTMVWYSYTADPYVYLIYIYELKQINQMLYP